MRAAIHALKYDRLHPAARRLGCMLALAIAKLAGEAPSEMLVVPVPLHRSKFARRGFNQARSLAAHALDALRSTHPQWKLKLASSTLMRLRATESQAGLAPRLRRLNVRGAFQVSTPSDVMTKHILLIDDILTTGATARAAAQALLEAGAASVWVATLARASRSNDPRDFILSSRGSFLDAEGYLDPDGNAPTTNLQAAFPHSSHHQSSF
jgi:ComF family protein